MDGNQLDAHGQRLPVQTCPICEHVLSAASSVYDAARPRPGDMSICVNCRGILVFTDRMTLRRATRGEAREFFSVVARRNRER